ncbi:hypothetical protein O6H91_03G081700 [Diphasiastrum complanatum]|uniref:Uncharacterized protein n=1 Tax=Diphasiastrum complanatum TaxID=34168 RepID=A0ACC2E8H8_DIPCM|nr:hypothetical protein O6H91_03G081700 [Diphasiastrum complanatum]
MASISPCAGCKFLRRKCTPECVFAPYFPPDQPHKFVSVHKIFGASNVTKLLNELPLHQREDAVNSLAYEAESRVKDPVYGCVAAISLLQRQVVHLQQELAMAQADLARITSAIAGPSAGVLQMGSSLSPGMGIGIPGAGLEQLIKREQLSELSREQLYELANFGGGSYEASRAALSMTRNTNSHGPLPSSRPRSNSGSGSSTGGHGGVTGP